MSEAKTYTGGCHCGKVRYEVTTELKAAMQCNCSICSKRGWLLTAVGGDHFRLLSGEVTDYQFGKKHVHHTFCPACGVSSFAYGNGPDGKAMYAINLRCLDDVDVSALPVTHVDGKSR